MIWILGLPNRLTHTAIFLLPYIILLPILILGLGVGKIYAAVPLAVMILFWTLRGWRLCINPECGRRSVQYLYGKDLLGRFIGHCFKCNEPRLWFTIASRAKIQQMGEPMNGWKIALLILGTALGLFARG